MGFDYSNIDGALTPEQAAAALAAGEGETSAELENGGAPEATTVTDDGANDGDDKATPDAAAEAGKDAGATTEAGDAAKSVVLARDGVHHIPYETLVKHREGEQHWKAQAEAAQQQLAELQAQAQARADAGAAPTKTDQMVATAEAAIEAGADAGMFGDFSEEALAKGIATLVEQKVAQQVDARVKAALEPLATKQAQDAASAHENAIFAKHPDADSIAQSAEFAEWVNAQPSAVRNAYWGLFDTKTGGTAAEIVEVFDAFKAASTPKTSQPAAAVSKAAASAAVAAAKAPPPASLSSIPGARVEGASVLDRAADMSGPEMLEAISKFSPEQTEAWLNRQI
jgi:hypothetical protein